MIHLAFLGTTSLFIKYRFSQKISEGPLSPIVSLLEERIRKMVGGNMETARRSEGPEQESQSCGFYTWRERR